MKTLSIRLTDSDHQRLMRYCAERLLEESRSKGKAKAWTQQRAIIEWIRSLPESDAPSFEVIKRTRPPKTQSGD